MQLDACSRGAMLPFPRWPRFKPSCSAVRQSQAGQFPRGAGPQPRPGPYPISPVPHPSLGEPTWRGRHGLQAGVGAAVVAAAPVSWALGVGLAACSLAGTRGQRAWGRRAAVRAGLTGAAHLFGLRGEGASVGCAGGCAPWVSRWASLSCCVLACSQQKHPRRVALTVGRCCFSL